MTEKKKPKHARLSPSSADRWLACPGSPSLCATVPDEDSSDYAEEGTAGHEVFEGCLRAETDATELVGMKTTNGWDVTEEMAEAVQVALDAVRMDALTDGGESFYELKVETGIHPELKGTLDAALVTPGLNLARVYDLKFGAGVLVAVTDNPQLLIYALGFLAHLGPIREKVIDEIEMVIAQPRRDFEGADGEDLRTRRWRVSKADLYAWRDGVLIPGIAATEAAAPEFSPAKKRCRWCPAAAANACAAMREQSLAVAKEVFAAGHTEKSALARFTASVDSERLGEMLRQADLVELWISLLRKHAFARAEHGDVAHGWKLVETLHNREWTNPAAAMTALVKASEADEATFMTEKKVVEPVMLSPAQAEKKFKGGKAVVKTLTQRRRKGTKLVDANDKRPALPTGGSVFGEIEPTTQPSQD